MQLSPVPDFIRTPYTLGVDLYHWDADKVDFHQLYGQGVRFAILKVTEGLGYVDPMYADYRQRANSVGIVIGGYHFFHPDEDVQEQVEFFWGNLKPVVGDWVPTLDTETEGLIWDVKSARFLNALGTKIGGQRPICYSSQSMWETLQSFVPIQMAVRWVARYGAMPTIENQAIVQYSETVLDADVLLYPDSFEALKIKALS